jgi:alanine racemase
VRDDQPTRAVVDLGAVRANFGVARRLADGREVIAVVKADAYGHGAVPVTKSLMGSGCRRFAVATTGEAVSLREAGVDAGILVLGGVSDSREAEVAVELGLCSVVHHASHVALLAQAAQSLGGRAAAEVEVDTGMRRMGVPSKDAADLIGALSGEPHVELRGVYTHYARAEEEDLAPSLAQLEEFRRVLEAVRARGVDPGDVHVANSAGVLAGSRLADGLPEASAIRPGLLLYGASPAPHFQVSLRPTLTFTARVVQIRAVRAGEAVGYGAKYRASRDTRVATLPVGYADGVPIAAGNRGSVWLSDRRVPIVGRVSMDFVSVDVGDLPVQIGDEAILFGARGEARLPVEEAAAAAESISYELLVRVGARVPRVYVE